MDEVNLNAMLTLKNAFKTTVGYSDHTLGIEVPIAAVALGAEIIEKHFTLDKGMIGPDHVASLNPMELEKMVRSIRNIENAMGDGYKIPNKSEINISKVVHKVIVAKENIKKGELFSAKNLTCKRSGSGISPAQWDSILGQFAPFDFKEDEPIRLI
jgi:sialic acid synthase SpsE